MSRMSHADVVVVVTAAGTKAVEAVEAGAKKNEADSFLLHGEEPGTQMVVAGQEEF